MVRLGFWHKTEIVMWQVLLQILMKPYTVAYSLGVIYGTSEGTRVLDDAWAD